MATRLPQRWGTRRRVDRERAIAQWHALKHVLEAHGVRVAVVPPVPAQPGLVYPANAGFLPDVDAPPPPGADAARPGGGRRFVLSNLLPSRAGETPHYRAVLEGLGFACEALDASLRFEGEADFFPAGEGLLLTHGRLERQRFVPAFGIPPWRRLYGFRTDAAVLPHLRAFAGGREILPLELGLEAHYHGDTALCGFGPGRRFLLAYRAALAPAGWDALAARFGDRLLPLSEDDARRYAANAFSLCDAAGAQLFLPKGLSARLLSAIRDRGVAPVEIDVSEFLKKGGGSVKCMIGDLGPLGGSYE